MKRLKRKSNYKISYVYCITSPSRKRYVGKTVNPARPMAHIRGKGSTAIRDAIKKYGPENMCTKILAILPTEEEAFRVEAALIEAWNTISPNGYNLQAGGKDGFTWSEDRKRRHRKRITGSGNPMFGKPLTPKHSKQVSLAQKGRVKSKEECENISKGLKGKPKSDLHCANISKAKKGKQIPWALEAAIKANTGKHLSKEHRRKIGVAQTGPLNHRFGKPMPLEERPKHASFTGRKHTSKTKAKQRRSAKKSWKERKLRKMQEMG